MTVKECYCVELSPSKKSIYGLRMSQILMVLVLTSLMASSCAADMELSCTNVRNIFDKKGMLSAVDIQAQPNSASPATISSFLVLGVIILPKLAKREIIYDSVNFSYKLVPLSPKFSSDDGIHEELRELFKNSRETYSDFSIFSNKPSICIQKVAFGEMELVRKTTDGHPKIQVFHGRRLVPLSPKSSSDDGIHEELRELLKNSRETYSDFSIFSNKPSICIQKVAFGEMELVRKTTDGHPKIQVFHGRRLVPLSPKSSSDDGIHEELRELFKNSRETYSDFSIFSNKPSICIQKVAFGEMELVRKTTDGHPKIQVFHGRRLVPLSPKSSSDDGIHEELRELLKNSRETYSDFSIFGNKPSICIQKVAFGEMELVQKTTDGHPKTGGDADGLCGSQGCCGAGARAPLTQQARRQLEDALRGELGKLADVLSNRAKRFDDFFRKLLQISREGFHAMFKRTYGMIYEQHSYVFEQLFEQLERYYTLGDMNFEHMMDHFFGILYQKMFSVLNAQYSFDENYLKCVNEHMREIQPFEDVPRKLSVQLRRAFVATRTFHKALRAGADVVRNMMQVGVGSECAAAWARLRWCGACGAPPPAPALSPAPACSRYCHNVLRGCLPAHADLADNWDAYVDAVEKVADRLLGPFNIAMVVEPIDIKISEAIMSFQEHNQEISQKIFAGCGKPVLGGGGSGGGGGGGGGGSGAFFAPERSRRSLRALPAAPFHRQDQNDVDDFEIEASFESLVNDDPSLLSLRTPEGIKKVTDEMVEQARSRERFLQYMRGKIDLEAFEEHERRKRDASPEPEPAGGADIDFRAYEFSGSGKRGPNKKKPAAKADDAHGSEWAGPALEKLVRETRLRVRATHHYWNHLPALLCSPASVTSAPCFNGTHVASYTLSSAGEGSEALAANPEVRGAARAAPAAARAQLDALPALTARLKDAYNGVEVQWKDDSDSLAAVESLTHEMETGSGSGSGDADADADADVDADADNAERDRLPDDDEDRDPPTDYPEGSGEGRPDDGESSETEAEPPTGTEPALVPGVVNSPNSNNVQLRGRVAAAPPAPPAPPAAAPPAAGAAARPSLQKALLTYALPVVCAWFGTIITDLI